uniref:Uncharacterized protein n=1 Tax=viral metagenome TaxID=1070528 RepID=A0A6H1ZGE1_9ZZZZ
MPGSNYDIALTIDSVTKYLRLMTQNRGVMWEVGELDRGEGNAAADLKYRQTDWSSGFGQYNYSNPTRYADGRNIDTTDTGNIILGGLITATTQLATHASLTTGDDTAYKIDHAYVTEQSYELGQDAASVIQTVTHKRGQTFTPGINIGLKRVQLYLKRTGTITNLTVGIYAVDGSSLPTGSALDSVTVDGSGIGTAAYEWVSFTLTNPFSLTASVEYAIVLTSATADGSNYINVGIDASEPAKPNSLFITYTTSWASDATRDALFKVEYQVLGRAQSFTTTEALVLRSVQVKLIRTGTPGTIQVDIYAVDGTGQPTGASLGSKSQSGDSIGTVTPELVTFTFATGISLTASTQYAIALTSASATTSAYVSWRGDAAGSGYTGGTASLGTGTAGAGWSLMSGVDLMFVATGLFTMEAAVVDFDFLGGVPVCATATKIFQWDNTNSYWTAKKTYIEGDNITDLCVYSIASTDYLFIARGASTIYEYTSNLSDYTISNLAQKYANYFLVAPSGDGLSSILWAAVKPNAVYSNSSGLNAGTAWTTGSTIGDTFTDITKLMILNGQFLIGKEDNLYHYDNDGKVFPLLPELKLGLSSNNFKHITEYKGALYFSLDTRIGEITSYLSYGVMDPYQSLEGIATKGSCVALTADRDYLYAFMYDGTDYICFKGHVVPIANGTQWSWCPWLYLSTNSTTIAHVSLISGENPKLWFGYGNTTAYAILSDNPLADTSALFAASGYLITGWYDAGVRDWDKMIQSVNAEVIMKSGDMSATKKVTVSYDINDGNGWVTIDTAYTVATSGTKKYVDAALGNVSFKKIRFKIALDVTGDTGNTAIVRYFNANMILRPEQLKVYDFTVDVGNPRMMTSQTVRDFLETGRDSTKLVTLNDRYGTDRTVVVMPGYPREVEVVREAGKTSELAVQMKCVQVDWS